MGKPTLNLYNIICQSYLNKKIKTKVIIAIRPSSIAGRLRKSRSAGRRAPSREFSGEPQTCRPPCSCSVAPQAHLLPPPPSSPPLFLLSAFHLFCLGKVGQEPCFHTCTPPWVPATPVPIKCLSLQCSGGFRPWGGGTRNLGWRLQKSLKPCWSAECQSSLCLVIVPPTQEVWWHRAPWLGHLCSLEGNSRLASPVRSGAS